MAQAISTRVEVCTNPYTSKMYKFNSIRKAMKFVREIANGGHWFIGIERTDRRGYIYTTN